MTRGMTLIEVMLAVSILAVMVILTWGSMSTSFRMRRVSLDKFERFRTVQLTMERISRELAMSFVTSVGQQSTSDSRRVSYRTTFEGDEDELTFTSLAHVRTRMDETASEQCEITYRVERRRNEDGDYVTALVRRSQAPIDDQPDRGGSIYVMLWDIRRVTFEYWDADNEIAGDAWERSWDAFNDRNGMLPERVRITIEIDHPTIPNERMRFSTQTQIMLRKPLVVAPPALLEEIANQQALQENMMMQQGLIPPTGALGGGGLAPGGPLQGGLR
jgi:general secretion pathway protein J